MILRRMANEKRKLKDIPAVKDPWSLYRSERTTVVTFPGFTRKPVCMGGRVRAGIKRMPDGKLQGYAPPEMADALEGGT